MLRPACSAEMFQTEIPQTNSPKKQTDLLICLPEACWIIKEPSLGPPALRRSPRIDTHWEIPISFRENKFYQAQ